MLFRQRDSRQNVGSPPPRNPLRPRRKEGEIQQQLLCVWRGWTGVNTKGSTPVKGVLIFSHCDLHLRPFREILQSWGDLAEIFLQKSRSKRWKRSPAKMFFQKNPSYLRICAKKKCHLLVLHTCSLNYKSSHINPMWQTHSPFKFCMWVLTHFLL